jgi:ectoine hydroxylase-related dioxygenase (phytanoyl-CoA dioxygenase family)
VFPEDLSAYRRPLSGLFSDASTNAVDPADFDAKGFITGIDLLNGDQIAALRADLDRMIDLDDSETGHFYEYNRNESRERIVFHALGAWRVSPAFHDLVFLEPMVAVAEEILGGRVRLWHDQAFVKPAFDGGVVAWHQDYSYWTRTRPIAHLTCWIALDDSDEENGCLHYVPGSHKWDLLPRTDLADDMEVVLALLSEEQKAKFRPVPMVLKAGQACFHHPLMLHGSYENHSSRPRRAAVVNFVRDGVVSDSDEPLLAGIPPIPRGQKLTGRFFPMLSQASGADETALES